MADRPKILFTTPVLQHPPASGSALRIENSIKALRRMSELHVMSRVAFYRLQAHGEAFYRSAADAFFYAPSVEGLSANRYVRRLQQLVRSPAADAEFACRYMDAHGIEILWAGYGNAISLDLLQRVKQSAPHIKIVCDTDSVWSRFVLRALPYETSPERRRKIEEEGRCKEEEERRLVNLCDITTAVSEVDADYYRGLTDEPQRVMIFSNAIDVDHYAEKPSAPAGFKTPSIYLAGTFWPKGPMDHAARWMIEQVFPRVVRQIPEIHFYIVGSDSDSTLADVRDPRITVTGKLDSVLPYLRNVNVALVPLFFESGTRFKILEAGACGVPLVSTSLGAEGLPVHNEVELLIADEPQAFADAIVRLVRNPELAATLAANCRRLIAEHFGLDRLTAEAEAIVEKAKRR